MLPLDFTPFQWMCRAALNEQAVTAAEVLKRRLVGLHQVTEMGCVALREVWEPMEEGLDR